MKHLQIQIAIIVAVTILSSCHSSHTDIQAEKDAIRDLDRLWTEDIRNKRTDNIMDMMASDAVFMMDNLTIIEGRDAVRDAQLAWYADTTIDFSTFQAEIVDIEMSLSGDMAYVRGIESYSQKLPEGITQQNNKWINIWKKVEGEWKAAVAISNSDNP